MVLAHLAESHHAESHHAENHHAELTDIVSEKQTQ